MSLFIIDFNTHVRYSNNVGQIYSSQISQPFKSESAMLVANGEVLNALKIHQSHASKVCEVWKDLVALLRRFRQVFLVS